MQIPFAEQLSIVGQRLHFMENFNSVIDQPRIPVETVHQLLVLAGELLNSIDTETAATATAANEAGVVAGAAATSEACVLCHALEQSILAAKCQMEGLSADVTTAVENARAVLAQG